MAKDAGPCVTEVGVDELAGNDAVSKEGLTVGEVSVRLSGVGRRVEPSNASAERDHESGNGSKIGSLPKMAEQERGIHAILLGSAFPWRALLVCQALGAGISIDV